MSVAENMWITEASKRTILAVSSTQMFCGALILFLLNLWLRRRAVQDWSLVWLCISLLSWSVAGFGQLLAAHWKPEQRDIINYFMSPLSSILFTKTAFQLERVKGLFDSDNLRVWPRNIVWFVTALSTGVWVLLPFFPAGAKLLDASASSLALIILGMGLFYSFIIYENRTFAGLTGIVFLHQIAKQFITATQGTAYGITAILNIASNTILTMLFIALATAWGLSDTSRQRLVGATSNIDVVAMFFDLRGSTQWAQRVSIQRNALHVGRFMDALREWVWKEIQAMPVLHRPDFVKFLGDGFLFVWEVRKTENVWEQTAVVIGLAHKIYTEYPAWLVERNWNQELGSTPDALGVGVDAGSVIRVIIENGSNDYLGAAVNNAAKLQDLARPNGGVVVRSVMLKQCESAGFMNEACASLVSREHTRLVGSESIHATAGVTGRSTPVDASLFTS